MNLQSALVHLRGALLAAAVMPTILAASGPAYGQAAAAKNASNEDSLETVLVTANKRKENSQQVPIAIAAITAETAEKTGVVNGQTLAQVVPGLQLNRQTNGSTPFIRGVGNPSTQAGTEPAVAMYVDDVYYGSSAVALTNYNTISRIEVLKGPQGTLFGRNATGGVINVFTKNPSDEHKVDFSVGAANYGDYSGSFYVSGKLSDRVSANLAAYADKQNNGWGRDFTTGLPSYRQHNYGARTKFLFNLDDKTSVLLNADYDDYFNQQAVFFRPAPGTISSAGVTSIPPAGIYDTIENIDPIAAAKQYGASAKLTHDFAAARLVSITAYRHDLATQKFAQDGSSLFRLQPLLIYTSKTYTQEFQLLSPETSSWSWAGGVFFLKDTTTVDPFQFAGLLAGGGLATKGAFATQDTKSYSGYFQTTAPVGSQAHVTAGVRYTSDKRSLEAGRQNINADGTPTPRVFALNSGISKSWSSVSGRLALDYQFTSDFMGYVAYNRGFKSGLFNTILAPSFAPGNPSNVGLNIEPPVAPETIDAVSLGLKSEFLNHRLRVNAEAFQYKYKNLQLQAVIVIPGGGTATTLTNAAAATMKGIDLDVTAAPIKNLTFTGGIELMQGKYDDFPDGQFAVYRPALGGNCLFAGPNPATGAIPVNGGCVGATPRNYDPATGHWNLKGNHTIQTPPFSVTLTANYIVPISSGQLDFTLNAYHTGNYYADADNGQGQIAPSRQANDKQGLIDVVNASVTWYSKDDSMSVKAWGKNLNNKYYWSFANQTATITKNTPAPPRTFGITFTKHF